MFLTKNPRLPWVSLREGGDFCLPRPCVTLSRSADAQRQSFALCAAPSFKDALKRAQRPRERAGYAIIHVCHGGVGGRDGMSRSMADCGGSRRGIEMCGSVVRGRRAVAPYGSPGPLRGPGDSLGGLLREQTQAYAHSARVGTSASRHTGIADKCRAAFIGQVGTEQ